MILLGRSTLQLVRVVEDPLGKVNWCVAYGCGCSPVRKALFGHL